MKHKWFSALLSFLLIWVLLTVSAWARQVVTEEVRTWAKEALEQEKALKTISAPNTLAILYFRNKTEWSNLDLLQKGLTIMLMTDLSKVEEIQLVERVKLQALVEELDLGVTGLVESETASRVGRLLGAEHLVGGDIIKGKINEFKLKSSLLEVPTEEVFGEPVVEGELLAELFRMEKELLFEIIEDLKIKLLPDLEAELRKYITTNHKALLYLFQGIEQSDFGNYDKAAEYYQMALAEDPSLSLAEDFLRELIALNLWGGEPEAYSEPEGGLEFEPRGDDRPDQRDPTERDPNDVDDDDDGYTENQGDCNDNDASIHPGAGEICDGKDNDCDGQIDEGCEYVSPQADPPPIVDMNSVNKAYANIDNDPSLGVRVYGGEYQPGNHTTTTSPVYDDNFPGIENWEITWDGNYKYGLQTVGYDYEIGPTVFTNQETLDWFKSDAFLAYAVQVEEDRINREILEMHREAAQGELLLAINTALASQEIRDRDAFLVQQADAQSGRVLKDREGNWVRVQQYILRPDNATVQLLNVCLRGVGDLAGLSTMDFTTSFTGSIEGYDLRSLPWDRWLDTQDYNGRYVYSPYWTPELDNMYVKFTNPGNESLKEQRWFSSRPIEGDRQDINLEQLTINEGLSYKFTASDNPGTDEYTISIYNGSNNNPGGFNYMVNPGGDYQYINVAFFVVGDGHTADNQGVSPYNYSTQGFRDIWDGLRVNEGEVAPYIGNNNLEICIDNGTNTNIFNNPIDVVYIPMSRMLWKVPTE